jgi:hypothetical protein
MVDMMSVLQVLDTGMGVAGDTAADCEGYPGLAHSFVQSVVREAELAVSRHLDHKSYVA